MSFNSFLGFNNKHKSEKSERIPVGEVIEGDAEVSEPIIPVGEANELDMSMEEFNTHGRESKDAGSEEVHSTEEEAETV